MQYRFTIYTYYVGYSCPENDAKTIAAAVCVP